MNVHKKGEKAYKGNKKGAIEITKKSQLLEYMNKTRRKCEIWMHPNYFPSFSTRPRRSYLCHR